MSQFDPGSLPPPIPVPAQALAYSTPLPYRRPGIVTAIGVMSIVIACLSLLANFGTGMSAWGFLMMSRMTARMSRSMTTLATPPAPPPPAAAQLSVGEVGVAVNTLSPMLGLDGPHERELDRLLRLHGREVFGGDDDTRLTGVQIRDDVTVNRKMSPSSAQPAQFTTDQGTIDVYANRAVFTSSDGRTVLETSARNRRDVTRSTAHAATSVHVTTVGPGGVSSWPPTATLTPAQVRTVVSAVKAAATPPLNPAQVKSLQAELSKPNQPLVMSGSATQVPAVLSQPGGNVTIYFNGGTVLALGPAGQVISSGPPPMPKFNISPAVAALVMIEAALSAALAVYLLVVGVIVLRGSFMAPRLLRIYAWIKIPLAILAGVGVGTLMYQFYSAIVAMPGGAGVATGSPLPLIGSIYGVVLGVLGLAFPIGVLIAVRSRTFRGYFNAVVSWK